MKNLLNNHVRIIFLVNVQKSSAPSFGKEMSSNEKNSNNTPIDYGLRQSSSWYWKLSKEIIGALKVIAQGHILAGLCKFPRIVRKFFPLGKYSRVCVTFGESFCNMFGY